MQEVTGVQKPDQLFLGVTWFRHQNHGPCWTFLSLVANVHEMQSWGAAIQIYENFRGTLGALCLIDDSWGRTHGEPPYTVTSTIMHILHVFPIIFVSPFQMKLNQGIGYMENGFHPAIHRPCETINVNNHLLFLQNWLGNRPVSDDCRSIDQTDRPTDSSIDDEYANFCRLWSVFWLAALQNLISEVYSLCNNNNSSVRGQPKIYRI